ncbi:MAG: protein kinase [bacterium]
MQTIKSTLFESMSRLLSHGVNRKVTLKYLPQHYTSDAEINKRFRREAKAAAALNHPNIITVYEIGEHEGRAFIAMEYEQGETLRAKVSSGQSISLS